MHGDGLTSLQHRQVAGGPTATISAAITHADVIELKREGRRFIMGVAKFGQPMVHTEFYGPDLGPDVHVGLFACSHNPKVKETATFTNVRIVVPPKVGWVPYRDYIGSNLEVLDIETGHRTVLHTSPISIQAPNWTTDGKTLIFNGSGKLWTFDLASKAVAEFNTGSVTRNNNDHVLSFDGSMLGISSASQDPADGNRSVVWVLPATGGEPKRVTANSPSYLHGWSLDKKWLFYTGQRNNELDIYKIPVDGGEEIRLTTTEGVDDGSEMTPDGQWIYFNSTRSGHMQIWRMKPDGSDQQQITFDRFNNWFPHIAPDGKSMVIISYGEDIQSADHPFYKHVYLRHLALDGSNPKVIAYVFGGQGTINVPSWSPDGKKIAFVSNTALPAPHSACGRGSGSAAAAPAGGIRLRPRSHARPHSRSISTAASAMHQAVRQLRRPQVERAVARKVQPAEVRQCLASRRRPVSGPARPAQAPRTALAPPGWAAWAAVSVPRGSRARSSSGRRRATRSPAVPRARPRRSGRTARTQEGREAGNRTDGW